MMKLEEKAFSYECTPHFGWDIYGRESNAIRRKLRSLGLESGPLYWPKIHELVAPCQVKVTGSLENLLELEDFMRRHGYDARSESNVIEV
jgi:hypothetical protein